MSTLHPMFVTAALLLAPLAALNASDFHVAPGGNDANSGTMDKPFATLERARDAVRLARATEPQVTWRIVLGGGTYRLGRTLVFDLRDGASGNAIYVSGTGGGNEVRNNFIHDIPSPNINASIRCDDDQHDTVIENNVITRICGEGFIWKGANTIRNNIVYDIREATIAGKPVRRRGYLVLPATPVDGSIVQRNIIVSRIASQTLLFEREKLTDKHLGPPAVLRTCAADHNLYFNTAGPGWGQKHLDAQRRFGIEQHSVEADPQFRNPAKDDFRLAPDSPALQLGFQPIDIATVGPRKP